MHLIWMTDIHLNFLEPPEQLAFYQKILATPADGVLISGDITEAPYLTATLTQMVEVIKKPIYFVLGNHDYYHGEVASVRQDIIALMKQVPLVHWLPAGIQSLEHQTVLLGEDGWADGRYGDYNRSDLSMNDHRLIKDFVQSQEQGKAALLEKMQTLADSDAKHLKESLLKAATEHSPKKIITLLHVPPFPEVSFYRGNPPNDNFLPFYACKATGEALLQAAQAYPQIEFLVLCGHTHHRISWQPLANLTVKVGQAQYGKPAIEEVLSL